MGCGVSKKGRGGGGLLGCGASNSAASLRALEIEETKKRLTALEEAEWEEANDVGCLAQCFEELVKEVLRHRTLCWNLCAIGTALMWLVVAIPYFLLNGHSIPMSVPNMPLAMPNLTLLPDDSPSHAHAEEAKETIETDADESDPQDGEEEEEEEEDERPRVSAGPLQKAGHYDLRVKKDGRVVGCQSPATVFPGEEKYGCSGFFETAKECDRVKYPARHTQFVKAVHEGCQTELGRGTYGYAYDDGVGLKQCPPLTRYEWVLCPTGKEKPPDWKVKGGKVKDSQMRFRARNECKENVWIAQSEDQAAKTGDRPIVRLEPGEFYDFTVPNKGLPSTRYLPKIGCDRHGNGCLVQSIPPCPKEGCDAPIDTKFEASWGCRYAQEDVEHSMHRCAVTSQGLPSSYQDWWDGSAVDGWTLPFSILTGTDSNASLVESSCGSVVCADLDAETLCPRREFLTPEV